MESEATFNNGTGDGANEHIELNQVWLASASMQQLPKILDALSNMARRSRCQFHRKGIFLGGLWPEKGIDIITSKAEKFNIPEEILDKSKRKRGILKTSKMEGPRISEISSLNEFWKRLSFTFASQPREMRTSRQTGFASDHARFYHQNLQGVVYSFQPALLLESFDMNDKQLAFLQNIFSDHYRCSSLSPNEQEILMQLQHLRVMFNVPLHKLLRERPKEYILPLPRRSKRSLLCSTNPHTRSLVFHQTVRILPSTDDQANRWLAKKVRFFGPMVSASSCLSRWNRGKLSYSRTVPKGVAFLTYPDTSGDETSFEGTIGERSMISWESGTKFPQMGVDQSVHFRCKKELSRQTMIQSRLYAARLHRRMTHKYRQHIMGNANHQIGQENLELDNSPRRPFIYVPNYPMKRKKPKRIAKSGVRRTVAGHPVFRNWFKFVKFPKRGSFRRDNIVADSSANTSMQMPPTVEDEVRCPEVDDAAIRLQERRRQAHRQERKRRLRIYFIKIIGFMSCGLLPYIMTGECYVLKRKKRVRIADSTERCQVTVSPEPSTNVFTAAE